MCLPSGRTDKVYLFFTLSDHLIDDGEQREIPTGSFPTQELPPPPLPVAPGRRLLRDNFTTYRDFVLSQGNCRTALQPYMARVNALATDYGRLRLFDSNNPDVANMTLPLSNPSITVGQYFSSGDDRRRRGGFTATQFNIDSQGNRTPTLVRIFLGPDFFTQNSGESQAIVYMHELLHGALAMDDAELFRELGLTQQQVPDGMGGTRLETESEAISRWLSNGCQ